MKKNDKQALRKLEPSELKKNIIELIKQINLASLEKKSLKLANRSLVARLRDRLATVYNILQEKEVLS